MSSPPPAAANGGASSSSSSSSAPPPASDDPFESFIALLHHERGRGLFYEFLKSNYSEHHLSYWEEVQKFKKLNSSTTSEEEIKMHSLKIYNEYVKNGVKQQINIYDVQRMKIKENLEKPTLHIFDESENIVFELIKGNYYVKFRESEPYKQWKTETEQSSKQKKTSSSACCIL